MNKHEATNYLTKILNKEGHVSLVLDERLKDKIEKDAISYELSRDNDLIDGYAAAYWDSNTIKISPKLKNIPEGMEHIGNSTQDYFYFRYYGGGSSKSISGIAQKYCDYTAKEQLIEQVEYANYLFIDKAWETEYESGYRYTVKYTAAPVSIITERDITNLKEVLKGDLEGLTGIAAEKLGITDQLAVDYRLLVKEEPVKFCGYFETVNDRKKEAIIQEVWDDLNTAPELIKNFLKQDNYKELILKIGRNSLE